MNKRVIIKLVQPLQKAGLVFICLFIAFILFTGCATETLFQSNFDATPVNQPPAHVQQVGTANVDGPAGSVKVISSPVNSSGKWIQVTRTSNQTSVSGFQGKFTGDGEYVFSSVLFIPSGSGLVTIQFEPFAQPVSTLTSFLHIDFTEDNRVRIDDNDATKFGLFPRNQAFIVQVTLNINAEVSTAHIVFSGAGASGEADCSILTPLLYHIN